MVSGNVGRSAIQSRFSTPDLLASCEVFDSCRYLISRMRIERNAIQSP